MKDMSWDLWTFAIKVQLMRDLQKKPAEEMTDQNRRELVRLLSEVDELAEAYALTNRPFSEPAAEGGAL